MNKHTNSWVQVKILNIQIVGNFALFLHTIISKLTQTCKNFFTVTKDNRAIKISGMKFLPPWLLGSYLSNFSVNFDWMILVNWTYIEFNLIGIHIPLLKAARNFPYYLIIFCFVYKPKSPWAQYIIFSFLIMCFVIKPYANTKHSCYKALQLTKEQCFV